MSQAHANSETSSSVSELAQLATILVPFAYILGQKYAAGYFTELNCGWAYKLLTFQETLSYSTPTALAVFVGAAITLQLLFAGIRYIKILTTILYIPLTIFLLTIIANYYFKFTSTSMILWASALWTCLLFGSYIADTIFLLKSRERKGLSSSVVFLIASSFTIYSAAGTFGSLSAEYDVRHMDKSFPRLSEGFTGENSFPKRLITKVGDKYLISNLHEDARTFELHSNLDKFSIETASSSTR